MSRRVVLRLHGQDFVLPDGRSLIGRGDACRVLLDDPRVSRRHARLEVQGERAELVDLDSANGVLVNGRRVETRQAVGDGDVITIGGHSLLVQVREAAGDGERAVARSGRAIASGFTAGEAEPTSRRMRPTRVSGATDLVLKVGEQALDAGQTGDAERVLRSHLLGVLEDARHARDAPEGRRSQATALALRLAHETRRGEWFDYVVELLRVSRVVCSPELGHKLSVALERVDEVDATRLRTYVAELRALPPSIESLRAVQELEQLAISAGRRHRTRLAHEGDTWRAPAGDASPSGISGLEPSKPGSSGRA